jgi:hypothetical protein
MIMFELNNKSHGMRRIKAERSDAEYRDKSLVHELQRQTSCMVMHRLPYPCCVGARKPKGTRVLEFAGAPQVQSTEAFLIQAVGAKLRASHGVPRTRPP